MTDFATRSEKLGFASPAEIRAALASPGTIVLDLRNDAEIASAGKLESSIATACTASDCPELRANPTKFVPDKEACLVLHCRSGMRASKAKQLLIEELGHTGPILNAGGYSDICMIIEEKF